MKPDGPQFEVRQASGLQRLVGLELVYGRSDTAAPPQLPPATHEWEDASAEPETDPSQSVWLLVAGNQIGAALVTQLLPGAWAGVNGPVITPPRSATSETSARADVTARSSQETCELGPSEWQMDELLRRAMQDLAARGARWVQVLVERDSGAEFQRLQRAKFERLTELLYLVAESPSFPDAQPSCSLVFDSFEFNEWSRLASIVERTYDGTLDCPQLNGKRRINDVLASYQGASDRGTEDAEPALWHFVQCDGGDVGCLLLTDHPSQGNLELAYMGLTPEARGHGWGIEIVRQTQWIARQRKRSRVVLAVDAENSPAIAMYAACGFATWEKRTVMLCDIDKSYGRAAQALDR